MTTDQNKAKIRAFYEEAVNKGNLNVIDDLVAPIQASLPFGGEPGEATPEGVKQFVASFRAAYPDLHTNIEALVAEGDLVVDVVTATYTHSSESLDPVLGRIAPTGRKVTRTWVAINRFVDGRSVETRIVADDLSYWKQIGFDLSQRPS